MANVKTAISLQKELFEQAEALAHEMQISRSQLFALALEDFLREQQNRRLLRELNAAYADDPDASERNVERVMRRHQRRVVEGEW